MTERADRFVILSGCSGGGKSTLLAELARRGHAVLDEPGRRIIADEVARDGTAVPWIDLEGFLRRAIDLAMADNDSARANHGITFFDRGLIDAAAALEHLTGEPAIARYCGGRRYGSLVFLTPPWPEIYVMDDVRRHDLDSAALEHERLAALYPALGYQTVSLPKVAVPDRADIVEAVLAAATSASAS